MLQDHVGKKLIRSCILVFMEDQTIEYIDKGEKNTPKKDISLSNIDSVWLPIHNLDIIGGGDQNDELHDHVNDQQLEDEVNIQTNVDEDENDISQYENLGKAPKSS